MRNVVCLIALAAAAVGGCEKANKDRVEKFEITVLDQGAAPRFVMRYAIPEGSKQSVDMVLDMDMEMGGAGLGGGPMVLPRMIMVNDLEITSVDAKNGGMKMEMTTTDVRVEDRPDSMPGVAGAMKTELDGMKGMRMTATLMPNGRTQNMKLDESSVSGKMREQMKQTEQMVDQMTTFLPDKAVGKGARWKVEQTIRQQGMRVNMTATYELLEISEKTAKVKSTIEMTAPPQTIEQNGIDVKLESMTAAGDAISHLDFAKMIEKVEADLDMDMRMSAMGQVVTANLRMAMQMLPSGALPKTSDEVAPGLEAE
jgi:Tfp pilus assembly protein PilO